MDFLIFFLDTFTSGLFYLRPLNSCFEIMWLLVVGGGGMRRLPLQFLGEDSQIKLYMNLNLVNRQRHRHLFQTFILTGLISVNR